MERELLALVAKHEDRTDPVDVLEAISREARLLAATHKLRRLMHRDAAAAGGCDGLFELKQRTKDGAAELVGEGGRMARRMRVREHEDIRLLDGTTTIQARVELLPRKQAAAATTGGADGKQQKQNHKQQKQQKQEEAVQLHFHFTRRPGPRRGSSMPYPAMGEEMELGSMDAGSSDSGSEEEEGSEEEGSVGGSASSSDAEGWCCGGHGHNHGHDHEHDHMHDGAPTSMVEYSISASPSLAEPPVQILHVVIYGLDPSGTPSVKGIRGPEDEEDGEGKDLGLVELDDEALQAALAWCCGPKSEWGEPQLLNFLLFFPYWEEEYNVPGLVMEQIYGAESGSEGEEDGERSSESEEEELLAPMEPQSHKAEKRERPAPKQPQQQPSPPAKRRRQ